MEKRNAFFKSNFKTRNEENGDKYIEGYFAVFDQETELWEGCFEKISPGAFEKSLKGNDIRCLFDHESGLVLGRNKSGTLELREDGHGLYGTVKINPNDRTAMDVWARVQRGDISGCSFGFYPTVESREERENSVCYTVCEADLLEVSVCTFPAYPTTEITARKADIEKMRSQKLKLDKEDLRKRLEELKC